MTAPPPGPCRAERTHALSRLPDAPPVIAVAADESGGLVAWADGPDHLRTVPLDSTLAPAAPERVAFPDTGDLRLLTRIGRHSVALGLGACPDGSAAAACASALALDATGRPLGAVVRRPLDRSASHLRRAVADDTLLFAHSGELGSPSLLLLRVADTGVVDEGSTPLGHVPEDRRADVLFAATRGRDWAVLYRVGAVEDPAGGVLLVTRDGEVPVEALHDAVMIDDVVLAPDVTHVLASFEFGRPLALRVRPDGSLDGPPMPIAHGAAAPAPFPDRVIAVLERDDEATILVPRTPAGDPFGPPIRLPSCPPSPTVPSVARVGRRFVVTCVAPDGGTFESRATILRCGDRPTDAR